MNGRYGRSKVILFIMIIVFGLLFGEVGEILMRHFRFLNEVSVYRTVGFPKPFTLDLKLVSVTFGISFNLSVFSLAGMLLGYFVYRKM